MCSPICVFVYINVIDSHVYLDILESFGQFMLLFTRYIATQSVVCQIYFNRTKCVHETSKVVHLLSWNQ